MQPYQYAIYEDDLPDIFDYMESVFDGYVEGDEKGYFTLSFNATNALYYYGFVTESSIYYEPIWIVPDYPTNPDDDGGGVCFDSGQANFKKKKEAVKFAMEKAKDNHYVRVDKDSERGGWTVSYKDKPQPPK